MSQQHNFGLGGVLFAGIVACLAASFVVGPVALVSLVIMLLTYQWVLKHANQNFNSDGSYKRKKRN